MESTRFSNIFRNLYTLTILIFFLIFVEAINMIRAVVRCIGFNRSSPRATAMSRYLSVVDEKDPVIRFENRLNLESVECAVCICELEQGEEIRELQCKHMFHKDCLDRWLDHRWGMAPTCPLCRSPLLPEETMVDHGGSLQEFYAEEDVGLMFLSSYGGNLHRLWATW